MQNSIHKEDLLTLIEYVNKKGDAAVDLMAEEVLSLKKNLSEELYTEIFESIKNNPDFRGPTGYTGMDGSPGPQGEKGDRGVRGPLPAIEISEDRCSLRFQKGTLLSEETGEELPHWSDWVDIKGEKGEQGLIGEQGPAGQDGENGVSFTKATIFEDHLHVMNSLGETFDLGNVRGRQGAQGERGERGEALTWHDLTESQRQLLVGPSGPAGPKGDPGQFPMVECDHEQRKVRFQVREDYTNPWGEWIDMPVGPQGDKGDKGDRWMYEDFKPEHLAEITGPQGIQGPQGPRGPRGLQGEVGPRGAKGNTGARGEKGEKGDKGNPGKDAKTDHIEEAVDQFKKKVTDEHTKFDKRLKDTTEKLRGEMTQRISDVRFTRLNELLIPTAAFSVAGDPANNEVFQKIEDVSNWNDIVNGAPVYIDNQIKASLREDVYDPDNFLIYASAEHISQIADGIIIKGVHRSAYIYRLGTIKVDPRVIEGATELVPGEYYYLSHPSPDMPHSQITVNKPTFGVAQLVGQAVSKTEIFVNTTNDAAVLNRTNMQIQGRNGSTQRPPVDPVGVDGDQMGDTVWDDNYFYFCVRDYDGRTQIWRRTVSVSDW